MNSAFQIVVFYLFFDQVPLEDLKSTAKKNRYLFTVNERREGNGKKQK